MPGDFAALPPEVNTARLQAGPGAEPMTQAAAAWTTKAAAYTAQASHFCGVLGRAGGEWQSPSGMKMVGSAAKMTAWLGTAAASAGKAAEQAGLQAAAHTAAYAATPQLPDIARNHTTHAVLESTNFLGINTAPIAVNEHDYFVRMWGQAVSTMAMYETETMSNLMGLATVVPPQPMTVPGVGVDTLATSGFLGAAGAPAAIGRDGVMTAVGGESVLSTGVQQGGRLADTVSEVEQKAEMMGLATGTAAGQAGASEAENGSTVEQSMPMATQMMQPLMQAPQQAMQAPQQVMQAPQQLMQGPQQLMSPLQGLLGPLQQMSSGGGFGLDATGAPVDQVGLMGASPFSSHPLAGGGGAPSGAGMLRGAAVPGSGGTAARTPLMASMTAGSAPAGAGASEVSPTAAATKTGAAPIGAMPMGAAAGRNNDKTSTVDGRPAPLPLSFDEDPDDLDHWD